MATKQLARDLGLLRKRSLLQLAPQHKPDENFTFTYLIVLDFESTCWENDKSQPQEIIEFPAVLLNTQTGQIESEFHCFLQPSERPVLSEFCRKLTGITQSFYGRQPAGLSGALLDLGIMFDGRQHSGLDDARNTARLAWQMIRDGCVMSITKTIQMNYTGRIEHQSVLPPGTAYARPATDSDTHIPHLITSTKSAPFAIVCDQDQSRNISCRDGNLTKHHHQTVKVNPPRKRELLSQNFSVNKENYNPTIVVSPQTRKRLSSQDLCNKTNTHGKKRLTERNLNWMSAADTSAEKQMMVSRAKCYPEVYTPDMRNSVNSEVYKPDMRNSVNSEVYKPDMRNSVNSEVYKPDMRNSVNSEVYKPDMRNSVNSEVYKPDMRNSVNSEVYKPDMRNSANPDVYKPDMRNSANCDHIIADKMPCCCSQTVVLKQCSYKKYASTKESSISFPASRSTLKVSASTLKTPFSTTRSTIPSPSIKMPTTLKTPNMLKTPNTLKTPNILKTASTFKTHNILNMSNTLKIPNMLKASNTWRKAAFILRTPSVATSKQQLVTLNMSLKTTTDTSLMTPSTTSFRKEARISHMKATPPLCSCGQRSRCRIVQKKGPNTGRRFFSCSLATAKQSGCRFFQWAAAEIQTQAGGSSVAL